MESKQPLLPAYVLSAIAVVAAALGSLVIMETATVKLVVPASKLVANVTMKGGPNGQDLVTTTIHADVSESQQGTASAIPVPPTFATGQVVFACSPCGTGTQPIPEGISVSTAGANPIHYTTQGRGGIVAPPTSAPGAHRAQTPGQGGNTAPKKVDVNGKMMPNFQVHKPAA